MKADMIVDLQFGSTGKGLLAAYLATNRQYTAAVSANGPNAGHTSFVPMSLEGSDGFYHSKVVRCVLPNSPCHSRSIRDIFIAPGSSFYVDAFLEEAYDTLKYNPTASILVHPHACIVNDGHASTERNTMFAIGSTQKGTAEGVIGKLRRPAVGANIAANEERLRPYLVTAEEWEARLAQHGRVLVEGSQGFSLGLNSGFYPYVTSRECSIHQLASDCLIPRKSIGLVFGACRTYPIRVANRYDAAGNQIGWSGPCYPDQTETSFEAIGVPTEYTTVTKLPRRVFSFSQKQVVAAVVRSGVDVVFLNFVNYLDPDPVWAKAKGQKMAYDIEVACSAAGVRTEVALLGMGPNDSDVIQLPGVRHERF